MVGRVTKPFEQKHAEHFHQEGNTQQDGKKAEMSGITFSKTDQAYQEAQSYYDGIYFSKQGDKVLIKAEVKVT